MAREGSLSMWALVRIVDILYVVGSRGTYGALVDLALVNICDCT